MIRNFLPRLAVSTVLLVGAYFAFFESLYLRDQSIQFGEFKITVWMWVFWSITAILMSGSLFVLIFKR